MLIPKTPMLLSAAVYHSLNLSPTAAKWDLKMELVVRLIRSLLENRNPSPVLKQQRSSMRDPGIKGKMWVSKVTLPAPSTADALDLICTAIDQSKDTGQETYTRPPMLPVEAEWTAYRPDADKNSTRPDLTEEQHYQHLMADVKSPITILYAHGGALVLMDPASHRIPCSTLSRLTGGRCLSVRYRLAPQNPFPAALLDMFIAYLSLMYPPPDALHEPVSAFNIVVGGDSAGGTLTFALLQLLLQINRGAKEGDTFSFHGHTIPLPLPLPAGISANSPWLDLTTSMPSYSTNYMNDYLPHPLLDALTHFPADDVWPTDPPRGDLYCETSMLCHPLVSPLAADSWHGACPIFVCVGDEMLLDENKIVSARAASQGVAVRWTHWEAMPHCAGMIFQDGELGKRVFGEWSRFITGVVDDAAAAAAAAAVADGAAQTPNPPPQRESRGSSFAVKSFAETPVDVSALMAGVCTDADVRARMADYRRKRELGQGTESKVMPRL